MFKILIFTLFLGLFNVSYSMQVCDELWILNEIERVDLRYEEFLSSARSLYPKRFQELPGMKEAFKLRYEVLMLKPKFSGHVKKIVSRARDKVLENFLGIKKETSNAENDLRLNSNELVAYQQYKLERLRESDADPFHFVIFEEGALSSLSRQHMEQKKFVNALNYGITLRETGQTGIKRATLGQSYLYEVKIMNSDLRLWGCMDNAGVLVLKEMVGHSDIRKILQAGGC